MGHPIEDLISNFSDRASLGLAGSRCRRCHEVVFPAVRDCPLCVEPDVMEKYRLVGHGAIRDYVVAERGPEGFEVPYVQAWLKLDDGPAVFSIIETPDPRAFDLEPGTPATMVLRRYGTDESGFFGWKFDPDFASHE